MTDWAAGSESQDAVHAVASNPSGWIEELFRAHAGFVANTLRRFGVAPADIPDQLQEVFLVLFRVQASFDPKRPVRPWIFGVTYRIAARYRRAKGPSTEQVLEENLKDHAPLADTALETKEAQALVLSALQAMEFSRRAVFVLADLEGESVPTIADALQIPLNTAYSRLRLAREDFVGAVTRLRRKQGERT